MSGYLQLVVRSASYPPVPVGEHLLALPETRFQIDQPLSRLDALYGEVSDTADTADLQKPK
jgi:hypothetical protein